MSREYFQKRLQSASGEFDAQACLQVLDAAKLAPAVLSLACDLVGATQQAERWEAEEKAKNKEAWALQQKAGGRLEEAELCGRKVEEYRKEEAQLRRQIKEAIERSQKEGGKA